MSRFLVNDLSTYCSNFEWNLSVISSHRQCFFFQKNNHFQLIGQAQRHNWLFIIVVFSSLCYKTDAQSVSMKRNASFLPLWKGGSLPISWARSHSMIKILRFSTTKIFVLNSIGPCTNIWTWAWAKYGVIIDRLRPTVLFNQICLVSRNIRNRYLVSAGICDLADQTFKLVRLCTCIYS